MLCEVLRKVCTFPDLFESPLDSRIERLRIDGDNAKIDELAEHPAEGWI